MTSQILKFVNSPKTQKTKYLKNKTLSVQIKKNNLLNIKGYDLAKNSFLAEVTFNKNSNRFVFLFLLLCLSLWNFIKVLV